MLLVIKKTKNTCMICFNYLSFPQTMVANPLSVLKLYIRQKENSVNYNMNFYNMVHG